MKNYIVLDQFGVPMTLHAPGYPDGPRRGLLLCPNRGSPVTGFITRSAARAALRRTARYAKKRDLPWAMPKWRVRVVQT